MIFIYILAFSVSLLLRLAQFIRRPAGGCDAYYFILCAEQFKKDRKIPITLPDIYILEHNQQWYPPFFPIFLAMFPSGILKKYHWVVPAVCDSLICIMIAAAAFILTHSQVAAGIAAAVYMFSPSVFLQTKMLTSRQLGSFFLNLTVLALVISLNSTYYFVIYILAVFMLIMTHKLNSQNFYLTVPLIGIWAGQYNIIFYWIAGIVAVFFLSGGFYLKILRSHIDILRFWNRNWKRLGAHQIYNSPIYGDSSQYKNIYFSKNRILRYMLIILMDNPAFIVVAVAGIVVSGMFPDIAGSLFFLWLMATYVLVFMIIFIPQLHFLGEAHRYLPAIAPVTAVLAGNIFLQGGMYFKLAIIAAVFAGMLKIGKYVLSKEHEPERVINKSYDELVAYINGVKEKEQIRIACIPNHLYEAIAYKCRVPVLWGGHSCSFKYIDLILPVWTATITELKERFRLTHLVVDSEYCKMPGRLKNELAELEYETGSYQIYKIA